MNIITNYASRIHGSCFSSSPEKEFQEAISQGNAKRIDALAKKNYEFIYKPLPNGELPLNFAIRASQPRSVQALIKRGANPSQHFDDQHFNAIATAYYKGDNALFNELLGKTSFKKNSNPLTEAKNLCGPSIDRLKEALNQNSPFAISKQDAAIFVCSVAWAIAQYMPTDTVDPKILQLLQMATMSPLFFDKSSLFYSALSLACMNAVMMSETLAPVSLFVNSMLTMSLAYNTLNGLKSCWRNMSLNRYLAIRKAVVVHAPRGILCFNQLRNAGQQLSEYLPASLKDRASNFLNFKLPSWFKSGPESYDEETYQKYLLFKNESSYPDCKSFNLKNPSSELECNQTSAAWKMNCFPEDMDIQSKSCQDAFAAFKAAQDRKFAPDYSLSYWRQVFRMENPTCTSPDDNQFLNCVGLKKEWNKACQNDFNSEDCIKAETPFLQGVKTGFSKDPIWRKEVLENHDCNTYSADFKADCNYKAGIRKITCSDPSSANQCKKAEDIFIKGIRNGFVPNYGDDFWQYQELRKTDCSNYVGDNAEDCQYKYKLLIERCSTNPSSEECDLVRRAIKNGIATQFKPNYLKSEYWRNKALNAVEGNKHCPVGDSFNDCMNKWNDWQNKCREKIDSAACLDAEALFRRGMTRGFDGGKNLWSRITDFMSPETKKA